MPRYTDTEFKLATHHSHRSKKGSERKRTRSPMPKRMGNSARGGCSYCNPKVCTRVRTKQYLQHQLLTCLDEDISLPKLSTPKYLNQIRWKPKFYSMKKYAPAITKLPSSPKIPSKNIELQETDLFILLLNDG